MALVTTDWSVNAVGDIRYVGQAHNLAPSYATVIEFHRWLQDLADDAVFSGDDEVDITKELPSSRSTDNIIKLLSSYNIDDASAEHLYDGSIIQGAAGVETIYDGIVNFGNGDVQIQIIQNGALISPSFWNQAGVGLNPDAAQGISHRFMVKTSVAGVDIDGRRLIGTTRTYLKTYGEFPINGTSRGNNVLALADAPDLNNTTLEVTISVTPGISNLTEGFVQLDVDGNGAVDFYSQWTKSANTINIFYEYVKWLTRDGSTSTIYGLNGQLFRGITHEVTVTNQGVPDFVAAESLSWGAGATAGTGQLLAVDDVNAATKVWLQLLTGVAPSSGVIITGNGGATVDFVSITDRSSTISKPFIGASTGNALIGAYGVGLEIASLTKADKVTDLTNTTFQTPNNVNFTVGGLVLNEDSVIVADTVGSDSEGNPAINFAQLTTTASAINTAGVTAIPVTATIPTDTPISGTIRIKSDLGRFLQITYTSYTGSTFTIAPTDFSVETIPVSSDLWISYIDTVAGSTVATFQSVFSGSPRNLVVIVRDGGGTGNTPIKQFISSAQFTQTDTTITAIRTSDL